MRRVTLARPLVAAALLCVSLACHHGGTATTAPQLDSDRERVARFTTQVEALRGVLRIPGLSAAVVRDGHLIWSHGFGLADVEGKIPATDSTPYVIASLTKTFTSTLLLRLVEQGAVSLEDPMRKYTDEIPEQKAKVRHVLSMTSRGNPGEQYEYDGARYSALTSVLERATGQPYRVLLAKEILQPLGMRQSVPGQDVLDSASKWTAVLGDSALTRYRSVLGRLAKPYRVFAGQEVVRSLYPPSRLSASAGLISTVRDLAEYDSALDAHAFLRPGTQQLAWVPTVSTDGRTLPYGLGWFVRDYRWQRFLWHYGYWPDAFSSLIVKSPALGLTLIVLANSDGLSAGFYGPGGIETNPIACEFLRIFVFEPQVGHRLPDPRWSSDTAATRAEIDRASASNGYDYACERQDAQLVAAHQGRSVKRVPNVVSVDRTTLERYAGEYQNADGRIYRVAVHNDTLVSWTRSGEQFTLFPTSPTTFFAKATDWMLAFQPDSSGKVSALDVWVGERPTRLTRMQSPMPAGEQRKP
jgi:CubicO group peptidase (beta-lactamase class C family)